MKLYLVDMEEVEFALGGYSDALGLKSFWSRGGKVAGKSVRVELDVGCCFSGVYFGTKVY